MLFFKKGKVREMRKEDKVKKMAELGYNPIHLFKDYYWLRLYPNKKLFHIILKIVD